MIPLTAHLRRQRAFSLRTFGPGARVEGVTAHLDKELAEVRANPTDKTEYADLLLLACDGVLRQGKEPRDVAENIRRRRKAGERWLTDGAPADACLDSIGRGIWECQTWPRQTRSWVWLMLSIAHAAERVGGLSWEDLWQAAADKLAVNKRRTWPDWRSVPEGQPIEHVRA